LYRYTMVAAVAHVKQGVARMSLALAAQRRENAALRGMLAAATASSAATTAAAAAAASAAAAGAAAATGIYTFPVSSKTIAGGITTAAATTYPQPPKPQQRLRFSLHNGTLHGAHRRRTRLAPPPASLAPSSAKFDSSTEMFTLPHASPPPLRPSPSLYSPSPPPSPAPYSRKQQEREEASTSSSSSSSTSSSSSAVAATATFAAAAAAAALQVENNELRAALEELGEEKARTLASAEARWDKKSRDDAERMTKQAQDQFREKLVWKQSSESWYDRYQTAVKSCTAVQESTHFSQWFGGGSRGKESGGGTVRRLRDLAVTALTTAVKG
jgi:hypothetical protein